MRIKVDYDLCEGHALCMGACPEVFEVSDMGVLTVLMEEPDPSLHGAVEQAAGLCPTRAISLER